MAETGHANLADVLSFWAARSPDAPALLLARGPLTYRDFDRLVWRAAMAMHGQGVRAADVVALSFARELPQFVVLMAAARLGATAFSLPRAMPSVQREEMLKRVRARFVAADLPLELSSASVLRLEWDSPVAASFTVDADVRAVAPRAPWLIVAGSGSTGAPKLIPLGHAQMSAMIAAMRPAHRLYPDDRSAVLVAADFVMAKSRALSAWTSGAAVVVDALGERTDPIALVERFGVTVLSVAVVHLEQLLHRLPDDAEHRMPKLRALVVSASTVSEALRERAMRVLNPNLLVCYGANEVGLSHVATPEEMRGVPGTVGLPGIGVAVEVVDGVREHPLPVGELGIVRLRTPGMISGYLDDEVATRHAFRDGWFYPGDLGRLMPDGQLVYGGRADLMMIRDGVNIYPAEIEAVVSRHPAVSDAAAVPLKSKTHQDVPICGIVLRPGATASEEELQHFATQRLGPRAPWRVLVFDHIPRNEQGKLIRAEFARLIAARLKLPLLSTAAGAAPPHV